MSFEAVLTSEVDYMNLEYMKKPISYQISEKKSLWLGLEPMNIINSCNALFISISDRTNLFGPISNYYDL